MLGSVLRLLAEVAPDTLWILVFFAAVIAVFVLYVGIALRAVLHAEDPDVRYRVFRDLLDLFRRGGRS
jgi:hypothetical protein